MRLKFIKPMLFRACSPHFFRMSLETISDYSILWSRIGSNRKNPRISPSAHSCRRLTDRIRYLVLFYLRPHAVGLISECEYSFIVEWIMNSNISIITLFVILTSCIVILAKSLTAKWYNIWEFGRWGTQPIL